MKIIVKNRKVNKNHKNAIVNYMKMCIIKNVNYMKRNKSYMKGDING